MPRHHGVRRRVVLVALVLTSMVLLTVFFREPATGALHSVQRGSLGVLTPLQSFVTRATEPFKDGWRWSRDLLGAQKKNQEMARELENLKGQVLQLTEAAEENARLKELLGFKEAGIFPEGCSYVVARVVGRSPTKWQEWVQIDRGTADGVNLNQPVVGATVPADHSLSGKGLVGKVIAVSKHAAQVQLLTDPESSVASVVQGIAQPEGTPRPEGILEGTISGRLLMDLVDRDAPVEEKRIVITSGFGQIYPKGIPVGVVESVGEEDVDIYKQIVVRPFVDFRALEEVLVVINAGGGVPTSEQMTTVAPPVPSGVRP